MISYKKILLIILIFLFAPSLYAFNGLYLQTGITWYTAPLMISNISHVSANTQIQAFLSEGDFIFGLGIGVHPYYWGFIPDDESTPIVYESSVIRMSFPIEAKIGMNSEILRAILSLGTTIIVQSDYTKIDNEIYRNSYAHLGFSAGLDFGIIITDWIDLNVGGSIYTRYENWDVILEIGVSFKVLGFYDER